jgi:hypothetical protein
MTRTYSNVGYRTLDELVRDRVPEGAKLVVEPDEDSELTFDGGEGKPEFTAKIVFADGSESYFYERNGGWREGGWSR